jgi:hypothetical protein
MESGG